MSVARVTRGFDAIHDNVATKAQLEAVRSQLDAQIAAVRAEIALLEHRLMTRLGRAIAVAVGIILAAIRYLPPHG